MAEQELSELDGNDLMDEIRNREILGDFETDELIEALNSQKGVKLVDVPRYRDFVVAIEQDNFTHGSGPKVILIVDVP